jgi:hypothetical protein
MNKKFTYLYIAFALELLLIFYIKNVFEFIISPLIILGAGIFLSVYPYFILKNNPNSFLEENEPPNVKPNPNFKTIILLFLGLSLTTIIVANFVIINNPIDVTQSDIIPFIDKIFVNRFMNNEVVYAPYTGFNYGTFTPGYLPFHWFPFVVCKYLNIKFQWMVVIIFVIASALYTLVLFHNVKNKFWLILNCILPFFLLFSIYLKTGRTAVQSIEVMILGYYLILAISLFSKNIFIKSIGLILPMLSRYSFLFWLPIYFYSLLRKNFKTFLQVSIVLIIMVLLFFIIPFVLPIPEMLKSFNANYTTSILGEWKGQSWQAPTDRPFQLFQGLGFASWFYQFGSGTLLERIMLNKNFLFLLSILSSFTLIILHPKIRKVIGSNMFSLLTLKFMLTIFYALIMIPYDYLNWLPLIVSVVILSRINHQTFNNNQI